MYHDSCTFKYRSMVRTTIGILAAVTAANAGTNPQVVFSKVQKTGSTTLNTFFEFYRSQPNGPGHPKKYIIGGHELKLGSEQPADAVRAARAKQGPYNKTFLWIVPLRKPVERVISHFYQDRPCKYGGAGSAVKSCKTNAQNGFMPWLNNCFHAHNYQSQYIPDKQSLMFADQIILNDRMHESLMLLHLQFPEAFPLSVFKIPSFKSYAHTDTSWSALDIRSKNLTRKSRPSCTDQWLSLEGSSNLYSDGQKCSVGCAGSVGYALRTNYEKTQTIQRNQKDIDLWCHAKFLWNKQRVRILSSASMTNLEFGAFVNTTFN